MHVLVIALDFPSPEYPYRGSFIGEQVRLLCEHKRIERVTVLSPTTFVPAFMRRICRIAAQASLPDRYQLVEGRCEVLFPRYLKAPGTQFLSWTAAQWCRIVDQTVAQFTKTYPVSLIHAHTGDVSSWAAVCAAKRHHLPCAVTYHGSEVHRILAQLRKGWQLCRDTFRLADLNLPVSRQLESILRLHAQPIGRCETLLLGVDQSHFSPLPELMAGQDVLFVGRIEEAKGVFDLLSAWVEVRRACPKASLTLVGPDHTNGVFLQKAQSLGIAHSVTLTGPLLPHVIADRMRQSQLFCLPSHREGTPVSVMEALSCGLPVVATRVGGIPDIVEHEKTGLLVDLGDRDSLATALLTLLQDSDLSIRMGQAAQAFAGEHLDARKTVNRLVELYGELLAVYSGKRPA